MASIAFIGLGNMGGPMAANLLKAGHRVMALDLVAASRDQARADGAAIAESSVAAVIDKDRNPRWSPPRVEDVTPEMLAPYLAEIGADELVFNETS